LRLAETCSCSLLQRLSRESCLLYKMSQSAAKTLCIAWHLLYIHRCNHSWKVGGDLWWGWMVIPFVFLLHPFPISRYCSTCVSPIPFPTLHFFSPSEVQEVISDYSDKLYTLPSKKMTTSCKSWRGPNTLGPRDLQSWRGRIPRPR